MIKKNKLPPRKCQLSCPFCAVEVWFRLSVDDPERDRSEGVGEGGRGAEGEGEGGCKIEIR